MRNFFRSVKYIWPYRKRVALSLVCVFFIAILWGGGFAVSPIGLKIFIDPEGLHGWAWRSLADDKFDVTIATTSVPEGIVLDGREPESVPSIAASADDSAAKAAGVDGEWILGVDDGDPAHASLRTNALVRLLAQVPADHEVKLRLYNVATQEIRIVPLTAGSASHKSEMLGKLALIIPEPKEYYDRYPLFLKLLAIFLASVLVRNGFKFFQEYLVQTAVRKGIMDLRCETFRNALFLPTKFYAANGTSDTTSRLFSDMGELSRGQITLLGKTTLEPAKAIATVAAALFLSWKLTLITFIAGPPVFILIRLLGRAMKKASRKALESSADLLETTQETLTGVRVVKAYTMESRQNDEFHTTHGRLYKQQRRIARIDASTGPLIESLTVTFVLVAGGFAGYYVFTRQMDPYVFMAWMACLAGMFDPVRKLSKVITRFQRSDAAAARVFEVYDHEPEKRNIDAPALGRHQESIHFENVSLRYDNTGTLAVDQVDLTIRHDETIAIVGPNGCGKTTLVSMLPRLLEPTDGRMLVDGQDVHEMQLDSLRSQVGLVTQDSMMFHATIAENIALGRPDATRDEIISAAKHAFVDEFVQTMPDGYDTIIGQHGSTLSGGQKQRISIARAILRDPAILIFDEATSQVDADSEHRISQAMQEFMQGRTTFLIAHRFATVMAADRIVVMNDGQIVDVGHHSDLIERCQLYRHLYNTQFSDTGGS